MQAAPKQHISINELIDAKENISPLIPLSILSTPPVRFDLSRHNQALTASDIDNPDRFDHYIQAVLKKSNATWGYGGWGEDRRFYESSEGGREYRNIHLGLDIWLPAGTSIHAPFAGTIYNFTEDKNPKGSGPMIMTEHAIDKTPFWILYANVGASSLEGLLRGKIVRSGDKIAVVGSKKENGGWPSHLHLQLICDIGKYDGAFPEYARQSDKENMLRVCPDPESLIAPFLVS